MFSRKGTQDTKGTHLSIKVIPGEFSLYHESLAQFSGTYNQRLGSDVHTIVTNIKVPGKYQ